MSNVNVPLHIL